MKLGAEPKRLLILAGLSALAVYMFYNNPFAGTPALPPAIPVMTQPKTVAPPLTTSQPFSPRAPRTYQQEFRPSLKINKDQAPPDLNSIDPRLRLDLLAKLQQVNVQGGNRSLFEFAAAPLPNKVEPKVIPKPVAEALKTPGQTLPEPPRKPQTPPVSLKFYGYTTQARQGPKRAFFLDGDEILVASEGDVVKKRYKVVRIGINSVLIEDLDSKQQQTLPLVSEAG
jgi:hypothetical protein